MYEMSASHTVSGRSATKERPSRLGAIGRSWRLSVVWGRRRRPRWACRPMSRIIRIPGEGLGLDSWAAVGCCEAGRLVRHESRRQAMARVAGHLSVEDLEAGFRSARDPTAMRHFQVIWLLARGHTIADVAAVTSFVPRWIEQLLARYNAHGPEALGDLRRRNGGVPSVLRPALLERLRARLEAPPPDGGLWSSRKVAAWMAGELGLAAVLPQRGWEALKAINWSV